MLTRYSREAIRQGPWWTFPLFVVLVLALAALLTVVAHAQDAQRDGQLVLTQWGPPDFSGLQMDTVTTFPEIKRTGGDMLIQLGQDEPPPTFTLRGSGLIAAPPHPPSPSDACKDALWSVLRGLVDTLAGHPQVATAPLLRWAADQCEDQPAEEEPNR